MVMKPFCLGGKQKQGERWGCSAISRERHEGEDVMKQRVQWITRGRGNRGVNEPYGTAAVTGFEGARDLKRIRISVWE